VHPLILRVPGTDEEILEARRQLAKSKITRDRAGQVRYGTADLWSQLGACEKRRSRGRDGIASLLFEIESADLQPCGGTHVPAHRADRCSLSRRCTKVPPDWGRVELCLAAACGNVSHGADFSTPATGLGRRTEVAPGDVVGRFAKTRGLPSATTHSRMSERCFKRLAESGGGGRLALYERQRERYSGVVARVLAGRDSGGISGFSWLRKRLCTSSNKTVALGLGAFRRPAT